MKVNFKDLDRFSEGKPIHIAEINNAMISRKNFSGTDPMLGEGRRTFLLVIPDMETAQLFLNDKSEYGNSWNVHIKDSDDGRDPFIYIPVKVNFDRYAPSIYLMSGGKPIKLNENNVGRLDDISFANVDLDITASDKEINGKTFRTAYLRAMEVTKSTNRFEERYRGEESEEDDEDMLPFD